MPLLVNISFFRYKWKIGQINRIIRALYDREPVGLPAASLMRLCLSSFYLAYIPLLVRAHEVILKCMNFPEREKYVQSLVFLLIYNVIHVRNEKRTRKDVRYRKNEL